MKVSVVVINFNSTKHTIECVESIIKKTQSLLEVIIVDNNSYEEERKKLELWLKDGNEKIKYIASKKNTGFALGNMLGANMATGEYLLLLNNDCLLINDAIDQLSDFMDSHPDAGIAGPKTYDGDNVYVPSFDYPPTVGNKWLGTAVCRMFDKESYPHRKKEYSSPISVPMISGSAMFFRRSCFNKLGGLDTNLFLYCEEEDISIRARKSNYKIYHVPDAKIVHFCGVSTQRNLDIEKEFYISLFYILEKNYGVISRTMIKISYILKELKKGVKNKIDMKLFLFLLKGPNLTKSMRHKMECS